MSWTDELREQVVEDYTAAEPTPETSMDIVTEIAETIGKTPNGVRMVLSKAGVYVTTAPKAAEPKASGSSGGGTRVSKADAVAALHKAIEEAGKEIDESITSKLTGKAAVYFTSLLS